MATQFGNYIRKDRQLNKPLNNPNFSYLTTLGIGSKSLLAQAFVSLWELLGFCEETNNNTPALNCASSQAFHDFSRDEETVCAQVVGGQDKALWSPQCEHGHCPSDSVTIAGTRKAVHKKVEL